MKFFPVSIWAMSAGIVGLAGAARFARPVHLQTEPARTVHFARGDTLRLAIGDTVRISRHLRRRPEAIRYLSTNSEVVSISGGDKMTAVRPGTASVVPIGGTPDTIHVKVGTPTAATNAFISEVCANVDSSYFADSLAISSSLPLIHEYHDCQRLIEKGAYSAIAGIFASKNVRIYEHPNDYVDGRLAAIVVDFVGTKQLQSYDPLGIKPGTNCLIIRYVKPTRFRFLWLIPLWIITPGRWEAALTNQTMAPYSGGGPHYGDCPDNLTWANVPAAQIGKLSVLPQSGVDYMNRPIAPPVSRWDWDPRHQLNYMGVKCARQWCEIGAIAFATSPPKFHESGKEIFKGYYDEQFLADSTTANPSTVFGTILPGADTYDKSQMQGHNPAIWYQTALLSLQETNGTASAAYNMYRGDFHTTSTANPLLATSDFRLMPKDAIDMGAGYNGMMNGTVLAAGKVTFMSHPSELVLPTVRWRWRTKDEGVWTFCDPDGCCEYNAR